VTLDDRFVLARLQLELIIESVIWPKRLIKEGFQITTIVTDNGRAFSGCDVRR
jgi:hypothetical protein